MAAMKELAQAIANLVHAGGDVADIGTLMSASADAPISYALTDSAYQAVSTFSGSADAIVDAVAGAFSEHKGWQIVVLQRGWVVVGDVTREGDELVISSASVIRKWGTSKGLGELVDGPLADTILDPAGTVRANVLGVVLALDASAEKWAR